MHRAAVLASSIFGCVLVASTLSACGAYEAAPATLTVENRSSFVIREVHLAPVGSASWGPDLLSRDLYPGNSVLIDGIACDRYDVLVVDETGVRCALPSIRLCFSDSGWAVDDRTLDSCAFQRPPP